MVAAIANGQVIYNPARDEVRGAQYWSSCLKTWGLVTAKHADKTCAAQTSPGPASLRRMARALMGTGPDPRVPSCTDLSGHPVVCCTWGVENWVPPYLALLGLFLTWSIFLLFEIKVREARFPLLSVCQLVAFLPVYDCVELSVSLHMMRVSCSKLTSH
jgi:hypothetical protein